MENLGTTPPLEPQSIETLSPDVGRSLQEDAIIVTRYNMRLNLACAAGLGLFSLVVFAATLMSLRGRAFPNVFAPVSLLLAAVGALLAGLSERRAYLKMLAAKEAGLVAPDPYDQSRTVVVERHWLVRTVRPLILIFLLGALGYRYWSLNSAATGPIVFRNASVTTSTGFVQERMTVAVADGRIVFVGRAEDSIPSSLTRARHIDALNALVSAATFDHSVSSPTDAFRHLWVGQVYVGAPGDLVITPQPVRRGRGGFGGGSPREILGAVVGGRYYTAAELQQRK